MNKFIDDLKKTFDVLDSKNRQLAHNLYAKLQQQWNILQSELSPIPNNSSFQASENELKELNKLKRQGIHMKFEIVKSLLDRFPDEVKFARKGGRKRTGRKRSGRKRRTMGKK